MFFCVNKCSKVLTPNYSQNLFRYSSIVQKMDRVKARSFALIIVVAAVMYNVPRFFEYDPTYSVAYVCPNTTLSLRWTQGTKIEDASFLVDGDTTSSMLNKVFI